MFTTKRIPTLKNGVWSYTIYENDKEFLAYVKSQFKEPGKYGLYDTYLWVEPATKFQTTGRYCDFSEDSEQYKEHFAFEKKKIGQGVIINEFYLPGDFYWYLNYTPIVDKLKGREDFAELWDGDYHFYLYDEIARLSDLNSAVCKARQKGFEQPNSEPVLTEHGFRPIGDLKVGDKVYSKDGKLTNVIGVYPQGVKDVYEIEFLDKRKVRCGINHLWEVRERNTLKVLSLKQMLEKGITYKATATLKSGEKKEYKGYRYGVEEIDPIIYPENTVPIPAYALGALLGDGSFTKSQCRLTSADQEVFDLVLEDLGEDYHTGEREQAENHYRATIMYAKRFTSLDSKYVNAQYGVNPLLRELKELGLTGTTCYNKFIPEVYLKSSVENRIALLQGLMDTDGYISEQGYDIQLTTTSERLQADVVELCRSLGIPVHSCEFPPAKETDHIFWRVRIGNKIRLFRLRRKKYRQILDRERRTKNSIINVVKLGKEESTCIEVDHPSHTYITKDYVLTHNTLKLMSKLMRKLWFVKQSVCKVIGYEEDFVNTNGSWKFAVNYRNFLNEHTPWYRSFEPDAGLEWEQKRSVIEGTVNTKKKWVGLKSRLVAATTKKNPAKAVGGHITDLFHEEAGIAPNLDKVLEFAEAATKMGGVKTGHITVSGAVGELKDCGPLENIAFNPSGYGFLGIKDIFSEVESDEEICFFFPDFWNYIASVDGKQIKCYDKDGNSDIELAKYYLNLEDEKRREKDNYILWKSQHPFNLQDAFAIREDNIFPTRIIKEHQTLLRQTYKPLTVELEVTDSKITHKISYNKPISTLKVDPTKDNRGVVEVDELPIDNPPWGLYYAGIDPIRQTNTTTSKSLMSVVIFKAAHVNANGQMVSDFPVARYTGRYPTWEETYETCMNLCKYYNARIAVESNVTGFHEWAIGKDLGHMFMKRKEIYLLNEWMPNSTIVNEIGIRMEGEFKKKALDFAVAYVDEVILNIMKDGEKTPVYGVTRLRDVMLLEEMLKYTPKLNTDRLVAFTFALIAARSNTNRNLVVKEQRQVRENGVKREQKVVMKMGSPFKKRK
jgi:hypothetical protein